MDGMKKRYDDGLDKHGYPTEAAVKAIEQWDVNSSSSSRQLLDYIESLWWMPEWGFRMRECQFSSDTTPWLELQLHTGGWSGNESIIYALQTNWMFWWRYWEQSRRGGHYRFRIPLEGE